MQITNIADVLAVKQTTQTGHSYVNSTIVNSNIDIIQAQHHYMKTLTTTGPPTITLASLSSSIYEIIPAIVTLFIFICPFQLSADVDGLTQQYRLYNAATPLA